MQMQMLPEVTSRDCLSFRTKGRNETKVQKNEVGERRAGVKLSSMIYTLINLFRKETPSPQMGCTGKIWYDAI